MNDTGNIRKTIVKAQR